MSKTGLEIAVIGIGVKLPNGISNVYDYWDFLKKGDRIVNSDNNFSHEDERNGFFVENKSLFDHEFFGYSKKDGSKMNPQTRIFHESVFNALYDSGYHSKTKENKIGLFASASNFNEWDLAMSLNMNGDSAASLDGNTLSSIEFLASRVSYSLNLTGPSVFINTACSSSLVATHLACQSLLAGDADIAVAGGVSISPFLNKRYVYQDGMIYSKAGECRPFDVNSDGTIPGEGVGVVVLKVLEDAIKDNDKIYGVISGSALNNDGNNKMSYAAPSTEGQKELYKTALYNSDTESNEIVYVETHGTGTSIGDTIEAESLCSVYPSDLTIGSVKNLIGHCDSAAGVLGLIKSILITQKREITPSKYFTSFNENVEQLNLSINPDSKVINSGPVKVAVSAFGQGGTNVQFILEEIEKEPTLQNTPSKSTFPIILPFGNHKKQNLIALGKKIQEFQGKKSALEVHNLCYSYQKSWGPEKYNSFLLLDPENPNFLFESEGKENGEIEELVFAFQGLGNQYPGMVNGLYQNQASFKKIIDNGIELLKLINPATNYLEILLSEDQNNTEIYHTCIAHPVVFLVEYALAQSIMDLGVKPTRLIGHSLGEFVAACVAEVFTLEDALKIVCYRGGIFDGIKEGCMLAIFEETSKVDIPEGISIATINSASQFVVSGKESEISALEIHLESNKIEFRRLKINSPGHSHLLDDYLVEFKTFLEQFDFKQPSIPIISDSLNSLEECHEMIMDAQYWCNHLRNTVDFNKISMLASGLKNPLFVEIGIGITLSNLLRINLKLSNEVFNTISIIDDIEGHDGNDQLSYTKALGELYLATKQTSILTGIYQDKYERVALLEYEFSEIKHALLENDFYANILSGNSSVTASIFTEEESPQVHLAVDYDDDIVVELIHIWIDILGGNEIDISSNFYELGGNSLKAIQMKNLIEKRFIVKEGFGFKTVLKNPTIEKLRTFIEAKNSEESTTIAVQNDSNTKKVYRATPQQERAFKYSKEGKLGNISFLYDMDLEHDMNPMIKKLLEANEILRSIFKQGNESTDVHILDANSAVYKVERMKVETESEVVKIVSDIRNQQFDLNQFPLFNLREIQVGDNCYLSVVISHAIFDGYSSEVMIKQIMRMAMGEDVKVALPYKDYSDWYFKNKVSYKDFWKEYLKNLDKIELNTEKGLVANTKIILDRAEFEEFSISNNTSLFSLFFTAYSKLLWSIHKQDDFYVLYPTSGRTHPESYNTLGYFTNLLITRVKGDLFEKSALEAIKQIDKDIEHCIDSEYNFEELVQDTGLTGYKFPFYINLNYTEGETNASTGDESKLDSIEKSLFKANFQHQLTYQIGCYIHVSDNEVVMNFIYNESFISENELLKIHQFLNELKLTTIDSH